MRLKYKKMILFITMWIMGIGMVTITFKKPPKADSVPANSDHAIAKASPDIGAKPQVTNIPTPLPTITPIPEDPTKLKKNSDEDLNELIHSFYQAMLETDEATLESITTETSTIDIEKIAKEQEYIEAYSNIVCYTKPGIKEGDLVVYVTYDIKITTIATNAPSIDQCYVTKQGDTYVIAYNNISSEITDLLSTYFYSEDVQTLVKNVDINLDEAKQSDSDLNEFINNLTNSISNTNTNASSEASDN